MKKTVLTIGLLSMVLSGFVGIANVAEAKSSTKIQIKFDNSRRQQREDARYVLRRTARVLERAQRIAREDRSRGRGHHYRGRHRRRRDRDDIRYRGLGVAFAHQRRAEDLYDRGRYEAAIDHSLQSRAIALRIIDRANRWDRDGWRDRNDDYYRYDMDRREMDDREYRYWDSRRSSRNELRLDIRDIELSDDATLDFRLKFDF